MCSINQCVCFLLLETLALVIGVAVVAINQFSSWFIAVICLGVILGISLITLLILLKCKAKSTGNTSDIPTSQQNRNLALVRESDGKLLLHLSNKTLLGTSKLGEI